MWVGETLVVPKIITITVDYLRSARPIDTLARATLTRQGRRIANVAVEAWQDDRSRPVAAARMHFLLAQQPVATIPAGHGRPSKDSAKPSKG